MAFMSMATASSASARLPPPSPPPTGVVSGEAGAVGEGGTVLPPLARVGRLSLGLARGRARLGSTAMLLPASGLARASAMPGAKGSAGGGGSGSAPSPPPPASQSRNKQ